MSEREEIKIGDTVKTYDVLGNPYEFTINRIEEKTEGGSYKWGKVYYDSRNHFFTEKAIGGIFKDSPALEREYEIIRRQG